MHFDPTTRPQLSASELATTVNDTPVTTHQHGGHKQINLDIVAHVAAYGPCGFSELYDLFGAHADEGKALTTERFRAKLGHLTYSHQIVATGSAGARRWRAPLVDASPIYEQTVRGNVIDCVKPAEPLPKWVGPVVPPRTYDCMHGATYVPERSAAQRPGSDAFMRLPSHGARC